MAQELDAAVDPAAARVAPAWPGWVAAVAGLVVALFGTGLLLALANPEFFGLPPVSSGAWIVGAVVALAGAAGLLGGLGWLAWRGVRVRRHLPAERYRGPSVILMFVLAVAIANLASVVPLLLESNPVTAIGEAGPLTVVVLLAATPVAFVAVVGLFVIRPRALAGATLADGQRTAWNMLRGVVLGSGSWLVAMGVSAVLTWVVTAMTGEEPTESQVAVDMARSLSPIVAVALIGIAAPVSEELFFRWAAVNAWAREKGIRVAVIGSTVLFGAAHLLGGSLLALPPIFLLGLILAFAYVRTRSLPLVVGMHAAFNCLSLAALFLGP